MHRKHSVVMYYVGVRITLLYNNEESDSNYVYERLKTLEIPVNLLVTNAC